METTADGKTKMPKVAKVCFAYHIDLIMWTWAKM